VTIISSPLVAHAIVKMAIEHLPVAASFVATVVEAHHICPGVDPGGHQRVVGLVCRIRFPVVVAGAPGKTPKRVWHWPTQRAAKPLRRVPGNAGRLNHDVTWV
jgi:hypothetical protein